MRTKNRPLANFAFLLLVLLSACRPTVPPGPDLAALEPLPPEVGVKYIKELRSHASQVESLRAKASLRMEGRLGEERLTQILVFERPDKLRLEFFATNLNRLTSLLITRKGMLHAVDPINLKVYRGSADPSAIERLVSIPFAPEELMLWSTGRFSPPNQPELVSFAAYGQDGMRLLQLKLADGRTVLISYRSDNGEVLVKRVEMSDRMGQDVLISQYDYQEPTDGIVLPATITFWVPKEGLKGTLKYEQVSVNPPLSAERDRLFKGRTPGNAEIIELGVRHD